MLEMKENKQQHIVIVGGGLAGSFLAMRLCRRGHRVSLFDDKKPGGASMAAAGLYNVITGRYGAKTWEAEKLLEEIKALFSQREWDKLRSYVQPSLIYRPFKTEEERQKWVERREDPAFRNLVSFQDAPWKEHTIINPFGGIRILPCGWVNIPGLIKAIPPLLESRFSFRYFPSHLSYNQIDLKKREVALDGLKIGFDHIVFAEGYRLKENPFFSFLKIVPNKGEILALKALDWQLPFVVSKKVYLIPWGQDHYVLGSNYQRYFDHPHPTKEGREEIESYLQKAIKGRYEVIDHWAGIRPTTPNHKAIVGTHPEREKVHVLGGFGTKGILQGPYFSRLLAEIIEGREVEIPKEAGIERFLKAK